MGIKEKLAMAERVIPKTENLGARTYRLHEGTISFVGDRSWFLLTNFIACEAPLVLAHSDLELITALTGEVTATPIDDRTVTFHNGEQTLELGIPRSSEDPRLEHPGRHEFSDMPEILKAGRNVMTLDGFSTICATKVNGIPCVVADHPANKLCVPGTEDLEMDLYRDNDVLTSAVSGGFRFLLRENKLYFYKEMNDSRIYAMTSLAKPGLHETSRIYVARVLAGDIGPTVSTRVKADRLLAAVGMVEKIVVDNIADYRIEKDRFTVLKQNSRRQIAYDGIPAVGTGEAEFTSRFISKMILNALGTAAGGLSDAEIEVSFAPETRLAITKVVGCNAFFMAGAKTMPILKR